VRAVFLGNGHQAGHQAVERLEQQLGVLPGGRAEGQPHHAGQVPLAPAHGVGLACPGSGQAGVQAAGLAQLARGPQLFERLGSFGHGF
jgi:hypothetical protein